MKLLLQMFFVLTLISIFSGGLLAAFDYYTTPYIEANRQVALKRAISDVLPEHDYYKEVRFEKTIIYLGMLESADKPVGLAFRVAGNGFQGKIAMMIGVRPDFKELTGLKVLEQVETPGLGTKIEEDPTNAPDNFWFALQFKGLDPWPFITMVKSQKPDKSNEIQAITGATISSQAVVHILNNQIKEFRKRYQGINH